jgi:Mg-chelatase subunit ChlD
MMLLAPIWLFLLLPLGLALWLWRPPSVFLTVLRATAMVLVVLALAGLSLRLPSREGTVVVVADRSLSMPANSAALQKEVVDRLLQSRSGQDLVGVVSFGEQVAVEQPPSRDPFAGFTHQVGGNASDLAGGLQTALTLIPPGTPGRIIVLSDGKWTGSNPVPVATTALARNIAIDYRTLERPTAGDLAIARVDAPSVVSAGESFLITSWIFAPTAGKIRFQLKQGDRLLASGERAVQSGLNRLTFRDRAMNVGNQDYQLTVLPLQDDGKIAQSDPVPENNTGRLLVGINGPRPILHVSEAGQTSGLARLLTRGGLAIHAVRPGQVSWTLEQLSRYSAVVLENLPAEKIGQTGMETLAAWVRETGSGLVMTGGRNAYGPGGYYKSPLDPILPVSMELRNEHRKLALAIVVALDRSGSMAVPVAGGKVKMDLANLGTAQVLDLLGPMDEFGCLAVDTVAHTIAPLQPVTNKAPIRKKILGIQSMGGGIYVYEALTAASQMLLKSKAGTKHIILFSDANDSEEPGRYKELLEKCEKAGITVSVIGLGTERDQDAELLKDIARRGKGRIFFSDKPEELPRLFAQDTFVVARNTFLDEPVGIQHLPGLTLLTDQAMPSPDNLQVGGYNLCYLRPGANLATVTRDEYKAPLAASWRAGVGRVVCYTGEADGKYAGGMARWERVGDYFTSLVRWAAGPANPLRDNMLLTQEVRDGVHRIQLHLDPERKAEPFTSLPRVTLLRSQQDRAPRTEQSTLRWTGPDTLQLEVGLQSEETALGTVEVPGHGPVPLPPVCLLYSPEFHPSQTDRGQATLEKLARATGGQERLDLASIWQDLPRELRWVSLAHWLLLAGGMVWLLEVLERRTALFGSLLYRTTASRRVEDTSKDGWADAVAVQPKRAVKETPEPIAAEPAAQQPQAAPSPAPAGDLTAALRKARQRARGRTE